MSYYCKLCDQIIKFSSKYKRFKSKTQTSITISIILRYIILNPNFDEIDEIMRKYVNKYNEKNEYYDVRGFFEIINNYESY